MWWQVQNDLCRTIVNWKLLGFFSIVTASHSLFFQLSFNDASRSLLYYLHIPIPICLFLILFAHFLSCGEQMWHCHCAVTAAASQPAASCYSRCHSSFMITSFNSFKRISIVYQKQWAKARESEKPVTKVSMVGFCVRSSPFALCECGCTVPNVARHCLMAIEIAGVDAYCVCHCMEHHFMVIRVHYQIW